MLSSRRGRRGRLARGVRQESPVETAPSQGPPIESTYISADSADTSTHTRDMSVSHVVLGGGVSELLLDPADSLHHLSNLSLLLLVHSLQHRHDGLNTLIHAERAYAYAFNHLQNLNI